MIINNTLFLRRRFDKMKLDENNINGIIAESLCSFLGLESTQGIVTILEYIDLNFEGIWPNNIEIVNGLLTNESDEFRDTLRKGISSFSYKDRLNILNEVKIRVGDLDDELKIIVMKKVSIFRRVMKNILGIPLNNELKPIDFDELYDEFRTKTIGGTDIAVTIISPRQRIDAISVDDRGDSHLTIILEILKKLGRIKTSTNEDPKALKAQAEDEEQNYISIHHIVSESYRDSYISIPRKITRFQLESLKNLKKVIEKFGIDVEVGVMEYNPITGEGNKGNVEKETDDLESIIKYIEENDLVEDYELSYGDETFIFSENIGKTM